MTKEERLKVFSGLETGCVTDAMVQLGVGRWMKDIFPNKPDQVVFGPAVPVQFDIITDPDKIIDQFQIVELCRPHDVLVWNVPSDSNIIGENIVHFIRNSGLGGIIIDGYARDVNPIGTMDLPAFFRGRAIAPAPRNAFTKELFHRLLCLRRYCVNPGDYVSETTTASGCPDGYRQRLRQAQLNMEYEKRMEAALDGNCTLAELAVVQNSKKLITD
jgi:regulator of RNase E activity RraA